MTTREIERSAAMSPDGVYRYTLGRKWADPVGGAVCWIMLNPSTADAEQDDPTIRRCMNFSESWGYDSLIVVNLFAFRATKPADMKAAADPIGPQNDDAIWLAAKSCAIAVAAWGEHGKHRNRAGAVRQLLIDHGVPLYYLDRSGSGQPKHPLYLPGDLTPKRLD